jgi:HPt (histidine-containing phosphotransfer) domain-containing protein
VLDPVALRSLQALASGPGTDASAVRELVEIFLDEAVKRVAAVHAAAAAGELGPMAHEAHSLRGASSAIGAAELASLCGEIEDAAKKGDLQRGQSAASRLDPAVADVRAALAAEFGP